MFKKLLLVAAVFSCLNTVCNDPVTTKELELIVKKKLMDIEKAVANLEKINSKQLAFLDFGRNVCAKCTGIASLLSVAMFYFFPAMRSSKIYIAAGVTVPLYYAAYGLFFHKKYKQCQKKDAEFAKKIKNIIENSKRKAIAC